MTSRTVNLDVLSSELHENAHQKGFYESLNMAEFNSQAKQLAMVHSEVTEVLEALRKEKGQEAVLDELADILIRVLDFYAALYQAGVLNGSLQDALFTKMAVNTARAKMHGVLG